MGIEPTSEAWARTHGSNAPRLGVVGRKPTARVVRLPRERVCCRAAEEIDALGWQSVHKLDAIADNRGRGFVKRLADRQVMNLQIRAVSDLQGSG